uniref:arsenate-mycothiol transferase ArsC n=1 Tax=Flavobacterium sp. TaxID=239 RepID=UPI00404A2963
MNQANLFPTIEQFVLNLKPAAITPERKEILQALVDFIQAKTDNQEPVRLNFICTHNSRRSHLSQVWAQTMAHFYGLSDVFCYSGGTEATALFPKVAETLQNTGFQIKTISSETNPVYSIKFSQNAHPIIGFSKKYDDDFNPTAEFAAILTCSQADVGCPFISGAEKRIPITYDDPKMFDNTPEQAAKYAERSRQIATEFDYVFSQIKK